MIQVHFSRDKAQGFLDALAAGKPIQPPGPDGWGERDLLALAGVCLYAVLTRGWPDTEETTAARLAAEATLVKDVRAALDYSARMTQLVTAGGYDVEFEPEHVVNVTGGYTPTSHAGVVRSDALTYVSGKRDH